jgi:undecaprenyl-diphosphatase
MPEWYPVTADRPEPGARFGVRALLAGSALAAVAVPFGLLLLLVKDRWRPLLQVDNGASTGCTGTRSTSRYSSPR